LIRNLGAQWDNELLVNIPTTMLVGLGWSSSHSDWRNPSA